LLTFRATSGVVGATAPYAGRDVMKTMHGSMRVILWTGLSIAVFMMLAVSVPAWLATTTSAQVGGGPIVSYPTPDPHP